MLIHWISFVLDPHWNQRRIGWLMGTNISDKAASWASCRFSDESYIHLNCLHRRSRILSIVMPQATFTPVPMPSQEPSNFVLILAADYLPLVQSVIYGRRRVRYVCSQLPVFATA